jgi:hypothetical protein
VVLYSAVEAIINTIINIPIISSKVAVATAEIPAAVEEATVVVVADINNENNFAEDLLIEAVSLEQSHATKLIFKQQASRYGKFRYSTASLSIQPHKLCDSYAA